MLRSAALAPTWSWVNHRFTLNKAYAVESNFNIENQYVYAFPYYIEGITDSVYELYLPDSSGRAVYAYGNNSLYNLAATGYVLKGVAFYLPKSNLTGSEALMHFVYHNVTREDTMFVYDGAEFNNIITNLNYKQELTVWVYNNRNDCSNLTFDCVFDEWSEWSSCSGLCQQTRNRTLIVRPFQQDCADEEQVSPCDVGQCQAAVEQVLISLGIEVT